MRHGKKVNHLGRQASHRSAMLSNMATSLILHKRINTTVAKAKALRVFVEPLITRAKTDSTHSRRMVFSYLQDKNAITELFRDVAVKVADRPGGYTRILKTGNRLGDNAEMCMMELVDYNENLLGGKEAKKVKTTRRRGGKRKGTAETPAAHVAESMEEVSASEEKVKKPRASKKKNEESAEEDKGE
jgi:large subunit ribosomal protein L17